MPDVKDLHARSSLWAAVVLIQVLSLSMTGESLFPTMPTKQEFLIKNFLERKLVQLKP